MVKTLLHLNFLDQVSILVNQDAILDYSLHLKVGNTIERKSFKEIDENPKEKLGAYLITVERYYLFQEVMKSGKTEADLRWEESYFQLVQFIEGLVPGYIFKWDYITRENITKEESVWKSIYTAHEINYNKLISKKPVFTIMNYLNDQGEAAQQIEWIVAEEELVRNNPYLVQVIEKARMDEYDQFKQKIKPDLPSLFGDFEDMLGE